MKSPAFDKTKSSEKKQALLLKSHGSELAGSLTSSLKYQSYYSKAESMFGVISYFDKTETEIQSSLIELHKSIREIEQEIDRRIDKYYPQLREKIAEKQYTSQQSLEMLMQEKELREELIKFQQIQIKNITETQKLYDSKDNVEFAIPIQINQTKKKILQLQKFIHIAEIKQKKKSEDVVKVQKTNLQQFQKIAMLRSNLQIAMIYEMTVNEKEMKTEEKIYDFQTKIETLNEKLANLNKVVEDRHILVSSNKGLLIMKRQKIQLDKARQEMMKKLALLKNNINRNETTIRNDIESMKKEINQKENRYILLQKQLQELKKKNQTYLIDESMNKSLRKSISYNYAETLLKVKQKQRLENPEGHTMNLSCVQESQLLKPNFKVKKLRNQVHSSLSKMTDSKKQVKKFTLGDPLLPITLDEIPKKQQKSPLDRGYIRKPNNYRPKSIGRPKDELQQQIISED